MTYRLTKRGLDVLKSRLDDAAGKHAACARAKTRLERFKLSPWPTPFPSPSYNDTWHRTPPVEAREEYDWIPPAEARERYEEWIYDGYGQPMEYEVWGQPKNDAGYDWHGNQVVWDYYNDEWCMPPAEAREEYEDADEYHDYPGEAEEYADDQDEEGYYDAQIAVYDEYDADDEEYDAPDEAAEEYNSYGPRAAAREEHEDYAEEEYEEYEDPRDDAREEYDEEFPAGAVQDDGYDEDWMGPRSMAPPAEKRVHYDAEDEYDDGYDEDWMGPRATAAEYPPSRRTGNSTEDWIPLPLTPPPVEAREQYAAPASATPWQQQVVQARGDLLVAQQRAWYPSAAPTVHYASDAMDTSAGRARGRAVRAKFPTTARIGRMTTPPKDSEQDGGQRGRCPRKEGNVAFEPLEYPREEDSHAYSVSTKEELLDWVKNGDQMYRDLLVPVCVLASSPSSAFRYKSYADFLLIILDFRIAVTSVWPQPSANRSLIQVGLIRPGRNVTRYYLGKMKSTESSCLSDRTVPYTVLDWSPCSMS
ncbi:hypothetical protein EDB85DRAFT_1895154 [Lactarius pseudohatsudake]|nr:hypothetical protein EDB85DRAFT_1895154 [Lactarius pseudohatsudake]